MAIVIVWMLGLALFGLYLKSQKDLASLNSTLKGTNLTMVGVGLNRKPYKNLSNNRFRGSLINRGRKLTTLPICENYPIPVSSIIDRTMFYKEEKLQLSPNSFSSLSLDDDIPLNNTWNICVDSSTSCWDAVNPANGLPICCQYTGIDIEGNPYGTSSD